MLRGGQKKHLRGETMMTQKIEKASEKVIDAVEKRRYLLNEFEGKYGVEWKERLTPFETEQLEAVNANLNRNQLCLHEAEIEWVKSLPM